MEGSPVSSPTFLIALSGLPGVGKSTVAEAISLDTGALVVSVDPIEDALHRAGLEPSFETGLAAYLVAEVVARSALSAGLAVVIDAANYVQAARDLWRGVARECDVTLRWVEVHCSDETLHRERLAGRNRGFDAALEPGWAQVQVRREETEPWAAADLRHLVRIDTALPLPPQLRALAEGEACRDMTGGNGCT